MNIFIPLLFTIPLIGTIWICILKSVSNTNNRLLELSIRKIALGTSLIVWVLSAFLWIGYINNNLFTIYSYIYEMPSFVQLGSLKFGLDGLSIIFVVLTAYILPISILSTWNTISHNITSHLSMILVLESLLILVFSSLDLIAFYVCFETVLIPLFLIIGLHGSTSGRTRAAYLLFLYTLLASFAMLLSIIKLLLLTGTTDMILLGQSSISELDQRWIWIGIFISIAVKTPLSGVHLWLFRAHSEASLAGSILLAGIVLKLAIYAYVRLLIPILPDACEYFRPLVLTLGCISLIHGSLATFRQIDSKVFIAYSSVAHLAVVIIGLASGSYNGIMGSIILGVAHGLISPALFIICGGIIYDRWHSRIIRYYKGLGAFMPSLKTWFFLASICSMAVPFSLNWIGELLCILGAFEVSNVAGILATSSVLLGSIYTIWLFNQISGGSPSTNLSLTSDITNRERTLLIYLIIPTFLLGIMPNILTSLVFFNIIQIT